MERAEALASLVPTARFMGSAVAERYPLGSAVYPRATEGEPVKTSAVLIALLASLAPTLQAQDIRGVWSQVEIYISAGPDSGTHRKDVQPGLLVFTNGYYSALQVEGFSPRPMLPANPTDAEAARAWRPFAANAGTYVRRDSTLSLTALVAKNPGGMIGGTRTVQVHIVADSLWLTARNPSGVVRQWKWVRVERALVR
jgi:hypothetical protein